MFAAVAELEAAVAVVATYAMPFGLNVAPLNWYLATDLELAADLGAPAALAAEWERAAAGLRRAARWLATRRGVGGGIARRSRPATH